MRCAFCHDDLGTDAGRCDGCGTRLHLDCARTAKTCPTLGCGRSWSSRDVEWVDEPPLEWWPFGSRGKAAISLSLAAILLLGAAMTSLHPVPAGGRVTTPVVAPKTERGQTTRTRFSWRLDAVAPLQVSAGLRPTLPGGAQPHEVLAACRSLLADPDLRGRRLPPDHVASAAPIMSQLGARGVVVRPTAAIVELGKETGLVALPVRGTWQDVEAFMGPRAYTLEEVVDGLWRYQRQ